jgi:hypothetical protein
MLMTQMHSKTLTLWVAHLELTQWVVEHQEHLAQTLWVAHLVVTQWVVEHLGQTQLDRRWELTLTPWDSQCQMLTSQW